MILWKRSWKFGWAIGHLSHRGGDERVDAWNSGYRGVVVTDLENDQGARVKWGAQSSWRSGRRDARPGGIGSMAVEITRNHEEQCWREWQWARAKASSRRGRLLRERGDKSSQRSVAYVYVLLFFLTSVSWSSRRWQSCSSQSAPEVTTLLSHHTPSPYPKHLLMFL